MTKTQRTVQALKKQGLTIISSSEPNYEEDGLISLEGGISVQVGKGYYGVDISNNEGFTMYPATKRLDIVIRQVYEIKHKNGN